MPNFEDAANALGQMVVQVSASAVRSNELAKSTKETYDTAMTFIQELRRAQKDQQELIEDLQKRLEEQPEEPPSKRLRTEEPWARPRRDPARSDYAESQVESQSGFLCYRCLKNCEVEIPDLEMSSILDLYTRIAHRGKKDERNEFDKVVEEFGRRGYRLPEDGKVAKRMREALQLYEKKFEKGMPLEYRVVPETPTPVTPGAVVTEVPDDDPEPKVGDQKPGGEAIEGGRPEVYERYSGHHQPAWPPRAKQELDRQVSDLLRDLRFLKDPERQESLATFPRHRTAPRKGEMCIFVGLSENSRRNEETLKTCLRRVVEGVFIFIFGVL